MALLKITLDNKVTVVTWLKNQLNKDSDVFLDPILAKNELFKFFILKRKGSKKDLYLPHEGISPVDMGNFVNNFLNDDAKRKLGVTLRVAESRLGVDVLQVKIEFANKRKLEYLSEHTGLTKVEIINDLIDRATVWDEQEGVQLNLKPWAN